MNTEEKKAKLQEATERYFDALLEAHATGASPADVMDHDGVAALQKLTASLPGTVSVSPRGANFVPTVTEIDATGRPVGYDLFSRLMKDRIVLLDGEVNDTMAAIACASLLFLAHIDGDQKRIEGSDAAPPIQVYINSPGGSVVAGMAIYDTIRSISAPVITVGMGMQASMGSILLAAGETRKMTKNSKLMIHSLSSGTKGTYATQVISLDASERLFDDLKAVYVRHIGLTPRFWNLTCAQDTWLSAEQALKMGYISEIIVGDRKPAPYESAAVAFLKVNQDKRESSISGKSTSELIELLGASTADKSLGERNRPEIIVELSQRPEFWTEGKKAEMAAKAAAAAPANDDTPSVVAPLRKKQTGGPTA